jgi:DNA-directed RNA polymerase subunit RPC12/RpoP
MAQYLKFKCIFCGQPMECDPAHAGRQIKCPKCDHKITIPPDPAKKPKIVLNSTEQTWTSNLPTPDVSTPTRYLTPKPPKPPGKAE